MNMNEYRGFVRSVRKPSARGIVYAALAFAGEAGEVANEVKKMLRDDTCGMTDARRAAIIGELGDCLWYLAALADDCGVSIEDIADQNREKLTARCR